MFATVSARQIQRGYKKVLEDANKSKEPIIVMSNNKPLGAIISLDLLEEALKEYKAGKTINIETEEDLQKHFKEIDELV